MEIITTILISALVVALGAPVAQEIVRPLLVTTKDKLHRSYRDHFEMRNVLILGGPGSGKTSLIYLLTKGKPYELDPEGLPRSPDPTPGAVIIGKSVSDSLGITTLNNMERILKDVGGEYVNVWKKLIREIDPHGIIYMVDGRQDEQGLVSNVADLFEHVLTQYPTKSHNLRALHVFVNFADKLDNMERHLKPYQLESLLRKRFGSQINSHLHGLKWSVSCTHLSPDASEWGETKQALTKFGDDMRSPK